MIFGFWGKTGQAVAVAATVVVVLAAPVKADTPTELASLDRQARPLAAPRTLPEPLSVSDVDTYKRIFAAQEKGRWPVADRALSTLPDKSLLGHVLAQRYLYPTAYRSRYKELKAWLVQYADHPQAERIYRLALKRRPKNWKYPKKPVPGFLSGNGHDGDLAAPRQVSGTKGLGKARKKQIAAIKRKIRYAIRKGHTLVAKRYLTDADNGGRLPTIVHDRLRTKLGTAYLGDGRANWAYAWASKAAKRSGKVVPDAHWTAGLAAWRLERFTTALTRFEAVAGHKYASQARRNAGAFWAARAGLRAGKPARVNRWLATAAESGESFYGVLARHVLGVPETGIWDEPPIRNSGLTDRAEGQRALALIQLGDTKSAEKELRALAMRAPELRDGIITVALRAPMPGLAMRLGNLRIRNGGVALRSAAYPVPTWKPAGGYSIDRALVYAIARQESAFNVMAKSRSGARGVMQILPSTAGFIAKDRAFQGYKRNSLHEIDVNLALGQKYIDHLMETKGIGDNLIYVAASWNGGPGNLLRWRKGAPDIADPLLFVECIPLPETRTFVKRIMKNLWMYRNRLGQPTPSLDAVASGHWPRYEALDKQSLKVARNVKN